MEKERFTERLTALRMQKGVSARDMSLSLGQSAAYMNNIENGVNFPSMSLFFYICEYLEITPKEFFDFEVKNPNKLRSLTEIAQSLPDDKLDLLIELAKAIQK